jgi:hypothetical protein
MDGGVFRGPYPRAKRLIRFERLSHHVLVRVDDDNIALIVNRHPALYKIRKQPKSAKHPELRSLEQKREPNCTERGTDARKVREDVSTWRCDLRVRAGFALDFDPFVNGSPTWVTMYMLLSSS